MMLSASAGAQKMAVLSDIHVTPGNANEAQLRLAVEEINGADYDLVVMNGDLGNEGSDAELINVKKILDTIRHPLFVLPGNHESTWSQSATKTFVDLWGTDRFVTVADSLVVIGISSGPFMKMGDGHIKQEDLHWLDATLAEYVTPGRRVLSFNHYPLLDDLDNMPDYVAILEKYPVIGHINGHYHRWRDYNAGGEGSGSDLPCVMVRALDYGDGDYGYSIIDVSADSVHIYNKKIGEAATPKYAFAAKTTHSKASFAPRPEIVAPTGYEVSKVWADSASIFTRTAADASNIYFGTSTGLAKAVSKDSGNVVWSVPTGASLFSRPVVINSSTVVFPMHDGIILAEVADGTVKNHLPSSEGPYVADGTLTPDGKAYIQGGYKRIERRNATDGAIEWVYDSIFNYCQASPAIDGDDLVFGAWDTNLRCLSLADGSLKWIWNNSKKANMLGPGNVVPVITEDKVFTVAPDRFMTAIDRRSGTQLWRNNAHRYRESLGASADRNRIYAKTMDGELVAVDATAPEFEELWITDLTFDYDHAPCAILEHEGKIYVGSRRGKVAIVDAADGHLIAALPLGVSEVNGIDLDPTNGDIYVSLIEGTVFRISNGR